MNKKTAGISLVALVITIIVLIILTAAVIVTFMDGGIIDRAKESVFKNDIQTYQEMLVDLRLEDEMGVATGKIEGDAAKVKGKTLVEEQIKGVIPEFDVEKYGDLVQAIDGKIYLYDRMLEAEDDLTSTEKDYKDWLTDLGIGEGKVILPENAVANVLNVGDYVNYKYTDSNGEEQSVISVVAYKNGENIDVVFAQVFPEITIGTEAARSRIFTRSYRNS